MDTKLHEAVRYGNIDSTIAALKENLNPNALGMLKWTPVQEAAHNGERDILFHLLSHGGDPNIQEELHGNTALHFAVLQGHLDCVQLLLQHKGKANLHNFQGKTCLDVASPDSRQLIMKIIMELGGWEGESNEQNNNEHKTVHQSDQHLGLDSAWNKLPEVPSHAIMGYLHLSFEYHKATLKIRVWQISDILLPPPQTSMIHSIFVRGYLIPDKAKKTNRRTEDVLVEVQDSTRTESTKAGIQHIFTPSSFRFRNPLVYTNLTADIVKECGLQLEVCMTQKYTNRTFLMAMVHMPLTLAVRRPIREKYPLIPCMNVTIPNNMRVYCAKDLQLESSLAQRENSPHGKRMMDPDSMVPLSARVVGDIELDDVISLSGEDFLRSHLSLCLDDDSFDDDFQRMDLQEKEGNNSMGSGGSSSVTLNMPSSDDERDDNDNESNLLSVITENGTKSPHTCLDICETQTINTAKKKKIIPNELSEKTIANDFTVNILSDETVVVIDDTEIDLPAAQPQQISSHHQPVISLARNIIEEPQTKGIHEKIVETKPTRRKIIPDESVCFTFSPSDNLQADDIHFVKSGDHLSDNDLPHFSSSPKNLDSEHTHEISDGDNSLKDVQTSRRPSVPTNKLKLSATCHTYQNSLSQGLEEQTALEGNPSFVEVARPETPMWDYYDFVEELQQEDITEETDAVLENRLATLRQFGASSMPNLSRDPILPVELTDDFDSLSME